MLLSYGYQLIRGGVVPHDLSYFIGVGASESSGVRMGHQRMIDHREFGTFVFIIALLAGQTIFLFGAVMIAGMILQHH